MNLKKHCLPWAALAGIAPSCVGTDVGNGDTELDFALYDSNATSARRLAAAPDGLTLSDAWLSVERVRLRESSDCSGGAELEFTGPFAVDMLEPGVPAALAELRPPASDYCRIEIRWDPLDAPLAATPAELVSASIYIAGERADGTPFRLRSARNDSLRLEARDSSFAVSAGEGLFFAFDIQRLFDGVDIDGAEPGAAGTIVIEAGSNGALLDRFDENLADAAKLFADSDGDRELDNEETGEDDILAE